MDLTERPVDPRVRVLSEQLTVVPARTESEEVLDRYTWAFDSTGRGLFSNEDLRIQLRGLLKWPGRVSGWTRVSHLWIPDLRAGMAFIYGAENARPWKAPGVARVDPRTVVASASAGVPPSIRAVTLEGRREAFVIATVCEISGLASLVEMVLPDPLQLPLGQLAEVFPLNEPAGDAEAVTVVAMAAVNAPSGLECAALVADAKGRPRGWFAVDSVSSIPKVAFVTPSRRLVSESGADLGFDPAYQLAELRSATRATGGAPSSG